MNPQEARTAFSDAIRWLQEGRGVAILTDYFPSEVEIVPGVWGTDGRVQWAVDFGPGSFQHRADRIEIGMRDTSDGPQLRIYSSKGPAHAEEGIDGTHISAKHVEAVRPVREEPVGEVPRLTVIPETIEAVRACAFELTALITRALDDPEHPLDAETQRTLRLLSGFLWEVRML